MKLSQLLATISPNILALSIDPEIFALVLDSRKAQAGTLFLAVPGTVSDGREFIGAAIDKGASAVLKENDVWVAEIQNNVPVIGVPNLKTHLSALAAHFYGNPAAQLTMIGVTGTNGKTSCSHYIAAAITRQGQACGVIGTIGNGIYPHLDRAELTTPDAVTLQRLLAEFVKAGVRFVTMEVSSHSLDQGRIGQLPFAAAIFTNLTRDHMDYHHTMAAYGAAKKRLFDNAYTHYAVINADDAFGEQLIAALVLDKKSVIAYSTKCTHSQVPTVYAQNVKLSAQGLQADINSPWGKGHLQTPLLGEFNLSNVLATLASLCAINLPLPTVLKLLAETKPVEGRMQALGGGDKPLVVIDYAHTPDALSKALLALKAHCEGNLYCLFGCGGDRDRGKRPLMAKAVAEFADHIVVSDDNPRHEDPSQIVADIISGFADDQTNVRVEHDRARAIQSVIQSAGPKDCILIAGKGAEDYQQIGDVKHPFKDWDKVTACLQPLPQFN